jgi:hypothetical protein
MQRIDMNDTPYAGQSRSFTVLPGGKSWAKCRRCASTLHPSRFESSGEMTIAGSRMTVDRYRCRCGKGHEVRRAAS